MDHGYIRLTGAQKISKKESVEKVGARNLML
jgi:hypothetical protein